MKPIAFVLPVTALLLLLCGCGAAQSRDDLRVWREFVEALKKGQVTADRVRPYPEMTSFKERVMEFLSTMREKAIWQEWQATPECYRVGSHLHCLIPLSFDGEKATYCFTFLVEGENWYFRHLEAITIRLDKIASLPTSEFPDIPESSKIWLRQESHWTEQIRLFNFLVKEKGKNFAFSWFADGDGYFLAAKAQVPFLPPEKAFVMYMCWEQAKLSGNSVTLKKLDGRQAIVQMKPIYFQLYESSGHLKKQISFADYRKIFETTWQDRASKAGWDLNISYEDDWCTFRLVRQNKAPANE
jgi:hypothetical protein